MAFNKDRSSKFPFVQLSLLALVRLAEPIALTSIFPYAYKLVKHFGIGDGDNASFYAGLLISAFSFAECVSGMFWGALSDRFGRKPILLCGCLGTVLSLLLLGFSSNLWMALAARAIGGLLNGNIGVIQTMVGELVTNPDHEPKAFAVMPALWAAGTILGPTIAALFSEPVVNFPGHFSPDGIFGVYPFLLPNLVCTALMAVAIVLGFFCIKETHPDMQPWSTQEDLDNTTAKTPLINTAGSTEHAPTNLANEGYGTFNAVEVDTEDGPQMWHDKPRRTTSSTSTSGSKAFTKNVVMLVAALGIFTYHSMTYDTLLPMFLGDDRAESEKSLSSSTGNALAGGLGLPLQQVGIILAVNGVIALVIQGVVFPLMASWCGISRLFWLVTVGHPLAYILIPFLVLLPESALYAGIYSCLTVRNFLSIIAYPVLLILLKEAAPSPAHLGTINGLAASVGAACRCLASPIGGFLYGLGVQINFTPLAWWASAFIAFTGTVQLCFMREQRDNATVHTLARHVSRESLREGWPSRDVARPSFDVIHEEHEPNSDDEETGLLPRGRQAVPEMAGAR